MRCATLTLALEIVNLASCTQVADQTLEKMLLTAKTLGYDLQGVVPRILKQSTHAQEHIPKFSVVIVGGGLRVFL